MASSFSSPAIPARGAAGLFCCAKSKVRGVAAFCAARASAWYHARFGSEGEGR